MKILAIKFKFLGDVALTVPSLRALKEAYPHAKIHFLVSQEAVPIVEFTPWADKIWGYPRKKSQGSRTQAFSILKKLRKEKFDLSIDFVGNDRGAWISRMIGAKKRIGLSAPKGFWGRKYCYTQNIPEASQLMHEIDRELTFLSKIGIPKPSLIKPELYSNSNLSHYAKNLLPKNPILCHINASSVSKEWPLNKWIEFYNTYPQLQNRLVFTSGASEREKNQLHELSIQLPKAHIIKDIPSIAELMALIDASDAVICGDTFTSHAAAGLGTPLIALFGPTNPLQWNPKGNSLIIEAEHCQCRHFFYKCTNNVHCLSKLPVSKVYEALNTLLLKTDSKNEK